MPRPPAAPAVLRTIAIACAILACGAGSTTVEAKVPERAGPAAGAPAGPARESAEKDGKGARVPRVVRRVVEVVPTALKAALAALAVAVLLAGIGALVAARRARRLDKQRAKLLDEVGVLQTALLPEVPGRLGALWTSGAYRPADGPAAGGDFYDVFEVDEGRVALLVGDVAAHGREALCQSMMLRHTLRSYLQAGLEPREALRLVREAVMRDDEGSRAKVAVALYEPAAGTLAFACAGGPEPIITGPGERRRVRAGDSPPLEGDQVSGLRQTTLSLAPGAAACFFTDGLGEARSYGELIGRDRLEAIVSELGARLTADALVDRVASEAGALPDDVAACVVEADEEAAESEVHVEELEVQAGGGGPRVLSFLESCGVDRPTAERLADQVARVAAAEGLALVRVQLTTAGPEVAMEPAEARPLERLVLTGAS